MNPNDQDNVDELRLEVLSKELYEIFAKFAKKNKLQSAETLKLISALLMHKMLFYGFSREMGDDFFKRLSKSYSASFEAIEALNLILKQSNP